MEDAAQIAVDAWPTLGVLAGNQPWARSSPGFLIHARRASRNGRSLPAQLALLGAAIEQLRIGAMLESQRRRLPPVQLMNFHQTKGREADSVIVIYGDQDYLAHHRDVEPFTEPSKLVYVALTRARREVTVVLGEEPHPLVAPLGAL